MVAATAGFDTTAPAADGNSGVAAAVFTSAHTSSTCASSAHVGQRAGPTHGAPPGKSHTRRCACEWRRDPWGRFWTPGD
eukprot:6384267-Alexandrium_andersonii.AAC.1